MSGYTTVKTARPLFRDTLRTVPAAPIGSRVFVRPHPIAGETASKFIKPDEAKERQMAGTLIAAGDAAADALYDAGVEIGDEIWYGRYAGIIEEWLHIVKDGRKPCTHEGAWDIVPKRISAATDREVVYDPRWKGLNPDDDTKMRECRECGALRLEERVVIMDAADIVCSVDLQVRLEIGEVRRERRVTADGKTRYTIVREFPDDAADSFEVDNTPKKKTKKEAA